MMRLDNKVETVCFYPKPVDLRKSIDSLTALVELDIKVAVFDPVLFVSFNKARNRIKVLDCERNDNCIWLKRLESERFKTSPELTSCRPNSPSKRNSLKPSPLWIGSSMLCRPFFSTARRCDARTTARTSPERYSAP